MGITKDLVALARDNKPYTTVLAANEKKKKKLFALLAESDGYFFYKPSDCPASSPVRPLLDLDERAALHDKAAICVDRAVAFRGKR